MEEFEINYIVKTEDAITAVFNVLTNLLDMKIFSILIIAMIFMSCEKYTYISPGDFSGVVLQSHKNVYLMKVKVKAESNCNSTVKIVVGKNVYPILISNSVDTSFTRDWYENPASIRIETDSCLKQDPIVGIAFID